MSRLQISVLCSINHQFAVHPFTMPLLGVKPNPATSASTVSSTPRLAKRRFENGAVSFLVGSGSYEFRVAAGKP